MEGAGTKFKESIASTEFPKSSGALSIKQSRENMGLGE